MKIARKTFGRINVLSFAGEFDEYNLRTIIELIDPFIHEDGTPLVFNLKEVKFINSPGLGYLIQIHKRLGRLGGELVISEPSKFFQSTITALGIVPVFRIFPDDAQALRHCGHGDDDGPADVASRL